MESIIETVTARKQMPAVLYRFLLPCFGLYLAPLLFIKILINEKSKEAVRSLYFAIFQPIASLSEDLSKACANDELPLNSGITLKTKNKLKVEAVSSTKLKVNTGGSYLKVRRCESSTSHFDVFRPLVNISINNKRINL